MGTAFGSVDPGVFGGIKSTECAELLDHVKCVWFKLVQTFIFHLLGAVLHLLQLMTFYERLHSWVLFVIHVQLWRTRQITVFAYKNFLYFDCSIFVMIIKITVLYRHPMLSSLQQHVFQNLLPESILYL